MTFNPKRRKAYPNQQDQDKTSKFVAGEKIIRPDRIRTLADDTGWVYKVELVREDARTEVARVYGWLQVKSCAESIDRRNTDRIFATPLYKVR